MAIPLLYETLVPQLLGADVMMAFGLWMHLAERHDHEHAHDVPEHNHAHIHDERHRHVHDGPVTEPHSTGIAMSRCGTGTPTIRTCTLVTSTDDVREAGAGSR